MYVTMPEPGSSQTQAIAWYPVHCENCDCHFLVADSYTMPVSFSLSPGSQELTPTIDSKTIARHLPLPVDPTPCPECFHYQQSMRKRYAASRYSSVPVIGSLICAAGLFGVAPIFFALIDSKVIAKSAFADFILAALIGGSCLIGIAMVFLPSLLRRSVDPNKELSLEKRRELTRSALPYHIFLSVYPDAINFPGPDDTLPPRPAPRPSSSVQTSTDKFTRRPTRDDG